MLYLVFKIGRKFRDEGRPKHGLLRCREFEMKGDGVICYKLSILLISLSLCDLTTWLFQLSLPVFVHMLATDLYTFDADSSSAEATFSEVCDSYWRIFRRLGLPVVSGFSFFIRHNIVISVIFYFYIHIFAHFLVIFLKNHFRENVLWVLVGAKCSVKHELVICLHDNGWFLINCIV